MGKASRFVKDGVNNAGDGRLFKKMAEKRIKMTKKNAPVGAEAELDGDTVSTASNDTIKRDNSAENYDEWAKIAQQAHDEGYCEKFHMPTKDGRYRAFTGICYPESMREDMLEVLNSGQFQGCISPLHDSDRDKNGKRKKAHYHVIVYFPGKIALTAVAKALKDTFGIVQVEVVHNLTGMVRYLAHMDIQPDRIEGDKGKVHYSPDEIIAFGGFDVKSYIKATATQISIATRQLIEIVREKKITNYADYMDMVYLEHPDFNFIVVNPTVIQIMRYYIVGNWQRSTKRDEHEYYLDTRVRKDD